MMHRNCLWTTETRCQFGQMSREIMIWTLKQDLQHMLSQGLTAILLLHSMEMD